MIRTAILAAATALALVPAAQAQQAVGGPEVRRVTACRPAPGTLAATFAQRAGTHAGWTWMDLDLTNPGPNRFFVQVTMGGQLKWQGYLERSQTMRVILGNGDGRITNRAIAAQTTIACGMNPPGG